MKIALLALLLAVAPLSTPAPGQGAAKKLKAAQAAALKDYKGMSRDAYELLDLELQLLEKSVSVSGWSVELRDELLDVLGDFQDNMWLAAFAAQDALVAEAQELLAAQPGAPLDGQYPSGFYPGDRGPFDDLREARAKADGRQYARVSRRLDQTAKALRAEAGVLLTWLLLPVEPAPAYQVDEDQAAHVTPDVGLDTLVGLGHEDLPGGGLIFAAGLGFASGQVTVSHLEPGGLDDVDTDVDHAPSDRWRHVNDGGGGGLDDGQWLVGARRQGDDGRVSRVIGLR
jgi:hypothetical protein